MKAGVLTRAMWGALWLEKHGRSDMRGSVDNRGVEGYGEVHRFADMGCSGEWKEILLICSPINQQIVVGKSVVSKDKGTGAIQQSDIK